MSPATASPTRRARGPVGSSDPGQPGVAKRVRTILGTGVRTYGIVLLLIVLVAIVTAIKPAFLSQTNVLNMLQQWAPVGICAMAGTFVLIGGGFDLSVGGIFVLAGVICATVTNDVSLVVGLAAALGVGCAVGVLNGLLVTKAEVNPFIATIGVGQATRGLALVASGAAPVIVHDVGGFDVLGSGKVGPVPVAAIVLVVLFLLGGLLLSRTVFGRSVYAVGGNAAASRLSGIRVNRVLVGTYVISGTVAGLAGAMYASRLGLGQADVAVHIEVDVIIAIVLGGTAVGGGVGAMWRTAVGVAILAVMANGMDTLNVASFYQSVIKGVVLVVAVAWDVWTRKRQQEALAADRARTAETVPAGSPA